MPQTELLTAKETAAYRRCSLRKQDRERAEGRGPAYVRIDGRIFYRRCDIDSFIVAHLRRGELGNPETTPKGAASRGTPSRNESGNTTLEPGS